MTDADGPSMTDEMTAKPAGLWRRLTAWMRPGNAALHRAEQAAAWAERRLREAIDVLPEGLVFLDRDGRYVLWNERYAEIYHRSADLFREGARLADTLAIGVARGDYPEAVGREQAWLAERLALLDNPGQRHQQQLADGRWVMIEERRTSDGGIIGLRVDITEMKEQAGALTLALERAEAASRAKSEFLANMSHEIRTPLNGVLGMAEVLARTDLDARQSELLSTIVSSAATLDSILADLLDFSRLEAGRLAIGREPFDLAALVDEAASPFASAVAPKGVVLSAAVDASARRRVAGDPVRLKQILTNLLSNAVKFTAEGAIALSVTRAARGDRYVFEVRDTGIGFEADAAERLFNRFEQADGSITRRYGGTGLGLSICRQLAELMGGEISAAGRPGKGAVFSLVLPLPPAADDDKTVISATVPTGERPIRVLIADDNETNRKVAALILAAIGAEVAAVEDGAQALAATQTNAFDVVLMDLQMPVMDGLSATAAIRAREAADGLPRLPIVVLSANVMREHVEASAAAGADDHIGKPVRAETLISAVVRAVSAAEEAAAA
ncbi:MAG TPA: ATP-binding protein [Caulobacteraceae bacterium]|nr:ATP-binding protein [Caulobacteraceae bacterium]